MSFNNINNIILTIPDNVQYCCSLVWISFEASHLVLEAFYHVFSNINAIFSGEQEREKSVIFGIDPDQKSDINKLVLMEIKYYIYYARCSKNNMNLTVLQHRLKLLYQTYKYSSISTGKYENFQTNWQNYHNLLDKTAD